MGACETTPPTSTSPGKPTQPTLPRPPDPRRLFLAPDHRPPLAGVKLVRPRRSAAAGAPAGPRTARQHKPAATRKATTTVTPARRPDSHRSPGQTTMPLDSKGPHGCTNTGPGRRQAHASCRPGLIYWSQLRVAGGPTVGISYGCCALSPRPRTGLNAGERKCARPRSVHHTVQGLAGTVPDWPDICQLTDRITLTEKFWRTRALPALWHCCGDCGLGGVDEPG